jgi:hypothetical protein
MVSGGAVIEKERKGWESREGERQRGQGRKTSLHSGSEELLLSTAFQIVTVESWE